MTWIWLSTIVVLAGATIDAEMEQRTVGDGPKPMSRRGATLTDTVDAHG